MQLASHNPVDGTLVGNVPVTPVESIPAVLAKARAALPGWKALGTERRAALISAIAPLLVEQADELAELLTREMGKPLTAARAEVLSCADLEAETREIVDALAPEILEDGRTRTVLKRDPYGVMVAITPWNFPISMPHWLVVPALVAGNTVVLKPSEETPLIADRWAQLLIERLPEGVLQIVHGDGAQGRALVAGDVDLIGFTGSRRAGTHILSAAAPRLKRVLLELGGKDPLVVLPDADVARAARFAARNSFRNTGQVCVSTERIYVPREHHDAFVAGVVEAARAMVVGDGMASGTDLGPMIHTRQKALVLDQVRDALADGAKLVFGDLDADGCFLGPLVLTDVHHGMRIMREETFGPVAAIQAYDTVDEAIERANDTPYGLGAIVFGDARADEVAEALEAGMVGINRGVGGAAGSPWVGLKDSGFGFHSGKHGHRQFANVRIVSRRR